MRDAVLHIVVGLMTSPWIYLALFVLSGVDGFFPAIPSDYLVITAGVFAVDGLPNVVLVIVLAALGAFLGDHVSYALGRLAGDRLVSRPRTGTRRRRAVDWTARAITTRGGLILILGRYLPFGRMAVTITAGAARYPRRRFAAFDGIAACSWALSSTLIGYLGGAVFQTDPVTDTLLGAGLALAVALVVEVARRLFRRGASTSEGKVERQVPV